MIVTSPIPANLQGHHCSSCNTLVFTTQSLKKEPLSPSSCPNCGFSSLNLLDKNSFQSSEDYLGIPYPQYLLVKKFFDYSHDRLLLLTRFSEAPPLGILSQVLEDLDSIEYLTIEVSPDIQVKANTFFEDGKHASSKGTALLLIQHFESLESEKK